MMNPRCEVLDMVMNNELALFQRQVETLRIENEQLRREPKVAKKPLV